MPEELDRPASVDALYIERGNPVVPWRPVLTGDVFENVSIPGVDEHELTMISSHPCTMRGRGGRLRERLQAIPIRQYETVPLERWAGGYKKVFPLPELRGGESVAARLDECGMVPSSDLDLENRICCLTEDGIAMLLQRYFACMSRVAVRVETIKDELISPMNEAELLEEWCEDLAQPRVSSGEDLVEVIAEEAQAFDEYLGETPLGSGSLQDGLKDPVNAVTVRRLVKDEIKRRSNVDS